MHTEAGSGKRATDNDLLCCALALRGLGELVDEAPAHLQVELSHRIGRRCSFHTCRRKGRGNSGCRRESSRWVTAGIRRRRDRGLGGRGFIPSCRYTRDTLEPFCVHIEPISFKVPSYLGTL